MALIDVFNPSHESQTVIAYVKEQIKDSIKKQETLNFNYENYSKENPEAYQRLMSFEKQKIELLLTLANDLYGRRIIDKYVCRRLKIKNTFYSESLKKESVKYLKENGWKNLLEVREKITNESK